MADENSTSSYGAVGSTQPINEDDEQARVRSVDSFYEDQSGGHSEDQRTFVGADAEKTQLHEKRKEEQEEKSSEESSHSPGSAQNHQHNNNGNTSAEKLQRPSRVSFSNEQPTNQINGAVTPVGGRHVSFIEKANQNEPSDANVAYDNRGCSDMQSSSDSLSRVRAITNCSVHYHTHSEGEECNESELSVALSYRRSSQTRRRRRNTKRATLVSDSFVNECICCCTII